MAKKKNTSPASERGGQTHRRHERKSGITESLVDAAVEIGHAAEHIKTSLEHFGKAREKGKRVIDPLQRAGKKTVDAVRKRLPGRAE